MPSARIPAGMRDILPEKMIKRQYVLDVVRSVFEEFGFEPLQTSAIELTETLTGKYGPDAERLIYKTWYGRTPGDEFSLRYDLSVPLCRVVAMYDNDIPRPFKRYQIAPVYRADRPQKGRYREFYQCDMDIVGTSSMIADAEIVAVIYAVLNRLGFSNMIISINNRKILDGIGGYVGIPDTILPDLYRSIDKLDKIGLDGVRRELMMVGIPKEPRDPVQKVARLGIQGKITDEEIKERLIQEGLDETLASLVEGSLTDLINQAREENVPGEALQAYTTALVADLSPEFREFYGDSLEVIPLDSVENLLNLLQISGPNREVIAELKQTLSESPVAMEGLTELSDMFDYMDALGVPESAYQINFAMVRGLAYYTGPIVETTITEPKAMPSITGGGRYDELIGLFMDKSYPATGGSLGIERIIDAMEELEMFPPELTSTTASVLVTVFDETTVSASLDVTRRLREAGINTLQYFDFTDRLGDQLGYAVTKGIPFAVILGPDEIKKGFATVRRLGESREDSEQREVSLDELASALRNW